MKEIKNIIFDLGVVILNLDRETCIRRFKELGIEDIERQIDVAHHQGIFTAFEKGEITPGRFYEEIRKMTSSELSDEEIRESWLTMITYIPEYKLDLLLKLRKHYNIFLLSNTNELHWDFCARTMLKYKGYGAHDFFEKIWLSNEIHLLKPSGEIFEYVLKDGNLDPHETLFLDDAPANCRAAETLGIRTYTPVADEDWSHLFEDLND